MIIGAIVHQLSYKGEGFKNKNWILPVGLRELFEILAFFLCRKEMVDIGATRIFLPSVSYNTIAPSGVFKVNYSKNSRGWRKWVSQKCFKILCKLGFLQPYIHRESEATCKVVEINYDLIVEELKKCDYLFQELLCRPVTTVLVGRKEWSSIKECIYTTLPGYIAPKLFSRGKEISLEGMKIIIVPWFEGVLPLPEDCEIVHKEEIDRRGEIEWGW